MTLESSRTDLVLLSAGALGYFTSPRLQILSQPIKID